MAVPLPRRKSAQVGTDVHGNPVPGPNKDVYNRRAAKPFSDAGGRANYTRRNATVSPKSMPVNDKDGGDALHTGKNRAPKGV